MKNGVYVLIRKELKELFYSVKGLFFFLAVSLILSLFSLLLITNTELSLLDNAQALYMISGIVLALMMLISVVYGSDAIAGERERYTLETLLITPLTMKDIVTAKLGFGVFLYMLLFAIAAPYIIAVGSSGQNMTTGLLYLFAIGLMLSLLYSAVGIFVSQRIRSFKNSLLVNLAIVLLSASPILISPALRQSSIGKIADYLNPFADAINTLDAVIIDSEPFSMQTLRLAMIAGVTLIIVATTIAGAKKEAL